MTTQARSGKPSISPVAWTTPAPSDPPVTSPGPLRTYVVPGEGPEDVLVEADGRVLTGVADGRIVRVDPRNSAASVVARTPGRPLGLEWLPDGRLLVCDAYEGLLAIDLAHPRDIENLTDSVDGQALRLCNNAAVAHDGTIWFTDSSARFEFAYWKADLLEHSGTGRLCRRDPDGTTTTVLAGLQFANGVALTQDESALFVAETGAYRLRRIDLATDGGQPSALNVEPALPGFPDNLSTGPDGRIWVAIASPRNPLIDFMANKPGVLRKAAWALPDALQPKPENLTEVIALDPLTGAVGARYKTENPAFGTSTGVRVVPRADTAGLTVWMGSLSGSTIAAFDI